MDREGESGIDDERREIETEEESSLYHDKSVNEAARSENFSFTPSFEKLLLCELFLPVSIPSSSSSASDGMFFRCRVSAG